MASEEVVLSNPVEQVLVHLNDSALEVLNVDALELTARSRFLLSALFLMPMLSLTIIANFN